jgi:hypothetical protein
MIWLSLIFFGSWLALTILNQFEGRISYRLRRLDMLGLIPVWKFFAPKPGIHDHYVLIQDRDLSGHSLEWKQVLGPMGRRPESFIWNPDKWENKAVADLVQLVAQVMQADVLDRQALMLTSPYLVMLRFALRQPCDPQIVCRRFALVRKQGRSGEIELSLASDFHPVHSA